MATTFVLGNNVVAQCLGDPAPADAYLAVLRTLAAQVVLGSVEALYRFDMALTWNGATTNTVQALLTVQARYCDGSVMELVTNGFLLEVPINAPACNASVTNVGTFVSLPFSLDSVPPTFAVTGATYKLCQGCYEGGLRFAFLPQGPWRLQGCFGCGPATQLCRVPAATPQGYYELTGIIQGSTITIATPAPAFVYQACLPYVGLEIVAPTTPYNRNAVIAAQVDGGLPAYTYIEATASYTFQSRGCPCNIQAVLFPGSQCTSASATPSHCPPVVVKSPNANPPTQTATRTPINRSISASRTPGYNGNGTIGNGDGNNTDANGSPYASPVPIVVNGAAGSGAAHGLLVAILAVAVAAARLLAGRA